MAGTASEGRQGMRDVAWQARTVFARRDTARHRPAGQAWHTWYAESRRRKEREPRQGVDGRHAGACNLISALKDGAFHTTPNRAGACTQPGYNGSSTHLPCQRSRGASVEGALAPTNSVPSLMYPVQGRYGCCCSLAATFFPPRPEGRGLSKGFGRYGCCCSLAATFFPPRPEGRGLSKGFGEAYLLTWHHTALDLATLKRLLDAELSEMTVYNAEMSKRLHIILALIARCG